MRLRGRRGSSVQWTGKVPDSLYGGRVPQSNGRKGFGFPVSVVEGSPRCTEHLPLQKSLGTRLLPLGVPGHPKTFPHWSTLSTGLRNPSFHHTGNPEPFLSTGLRNPSFPPPYREPGTFPVYWTEEPFLPSTIQGTRNLSCLLD